MDTVFTLSVCLTLLLLGTLVSSENREGEGPSAETLRRYLSLYGSRPQLDRLKTGEFYGPGNLYLDADEGSPYDRSPPYGGARAAPTRSRWTGTGQPEVVVDLGPFQSPDPEAEMENMPQEEQQDIGEEVTQTRNTQEVPDQQKKSEQKEMSRKDDPSQPLPFVQERAGAEVKTKNPLSDVYFVVIVAGCSAAAIFGVIAAGYCFYRFQKNSKAAAEVDYPAYGVTGPNKDQTSPNGDRRLAQSAQMYHYQHQKQQMIAVEKATTARNTSASDIDSEEENEEGDYTVYECPGLAPTGEMEVKNPLFQDDSTPMSPPVVTKESKKA